MDSKVEFLQSNAEFVKNDKDARTLLDLFTASAFFEAARTSDGRLILDRYDSVVPVSSAEYDTVVNSAYYLAVTMMNRQLGNLAEFYKNSLLFLAYTPIEQLDEASRQRIGSEVALAALCAEKVYQFNELV